MVDRGTFLSIIIIIIVINSCLLPGTNKIFQEIPPTLSLSLACRHSSSCCDVFPPSPSYSKIYIQRQQKLTQLTEQVNECEKKIASTTKLLKQAGSGREQSVSITNLLFSNLIRPQIINLLSIGQQVVAYIFMTSFVIL